MMGAIQPLSSKYIKFPFDDSQLSEWKFFETAGITNVIDYTHKHLKPQSFND